MKNWDSVGNSEDRRTILKWWHRKVQDRPGIEAKNRIDDEKTEFNGNAKEDGRSPDYGEKKMMPKGDHGRTLPTYRSDILFVLALGLIVGVYVALLVGMLSATVSYVELPVIGEVFTNERYRYAVLLSLISCSITTVLSVWVAVPTAYLMSRVNFSGKGLLDAILDIPIVLPPLVIGLALLMLFQTEVGRFIQSYVRFTYAIPGVILAQFMVACAFAIRTMMAAFSEINPRQEHVAMTLGCSRAQAFFRVVLPEARRGMIPAATIAWARAMGEFGPVLVFAGTTAMRTEVMPTSIFLELQVGNLSMAAGISIVMVVFAVIILMLVRLAGKGTQSFM